MDILLHADVFFYKILQFDIHPEWYRPLKKQGEFFLIKAAQIYIVEKPAEPLIMGGIKTLFFSIGTQQLLLHLRDGHGAPLCPVVVLPQRPFMPEKLSRDFIGSRLHVKYNADTLAFLRVRLFQLQNDGRREISVSQIGKFIIFPYVHHASQILNQAAVGIIRGRFIEKASSVRVGIQNYLHRINHSRFSAAGVPGEKVDFFAEGKSLPADIMPVIQADAGKCHKALPVSLRLLYHHRPPQSPVPKRN